MNGIVNLLYPWWGITFIFLIGLGWTLILEKKFHQFLSLSLLFPTSFLLGLANSSFLLYLLSLLNLSWNRPFILGVCLITASYGYFIGHTLFRNHVDQLISFLKNQRFRLPLIMVSVLLSVIIGFLFEIDLKHDFLHSDSLAYWFLRAKIFYQDKKISIDQLNNLPFNTAVTDPENPQNQLGFTMLQYPVMVPLTIGMNHLIYGQAAVIPAKYLWLSIELVIASMLWYLGRITFPKQRFSGFLAVLLFYTIPATGLRFSVHQFGFADIWLAGFSLMGLWYFQRWLKQRQGFHLLLAAIFLTGSVMCKMEGIVLWSLVPLFLISLKSHPKLSLPALIIFLLVPLSWYLLVAQIKTQTGIFNSTLGLIKTGQFNFDGAGEIISTYLSELINIKSQGLVWTTFLITFIYLLITKKSKLGSQFWVQSVTFVGLLFIISNYFILPYTVSKITVIHQNISRFSSQWYPTLIMFTLQNLSVISPKSLRKHHQP